MIESDDMPELRRPVVIASFEGWNDAAEAASMAVTHLIEVWDADPIAAMDPEDYYDFQVNRPRISTVDGERRITWPTTRVLAAALPDHEHDIVIVQGIEPSTRWRSYVIELLELVQELDGAMLICLGALLADVPHSRPFPVSLSSTDQRLIHRHHVERSDYEGPIGITGVFTDAAQQTDLPSMACWASVPHYAGGGTSHKATLALVDKLSEVLGLPIPLGDLPDLAKAWERGVDELAAADPEVADYVQSLEQAQDTAEHPQASGDAIAREFERYLRRHEDPPVAGGLPGPPGEVAGGTSAPGGAPGRSSDDIGGGGRSGSGRDASPSAGGAKDAGDGDEGGPPA